MNNKQTILLIDDDLDLLEEIADSLSLAGYNAKAFSDPVVARREIVADFNGIIVSDIRMPGVSGHELLDYAQGIDPDLPFVMITGHGQVAEATAAMKAGAYDFLEKPIDPDLLLVVARRALEKRQLTLQNRQLKLLIDDNAMAGRIIGNSKKIEALRDQIAMLAPLDIDLVLKGETGAGKDMVARALHDYSDRKNGPFVAVNCGALPENLVDSAFFGHERGAFTGAENQHKGYFETANGGTLFLDELESMPMAFQTRLLRVLESRQISRLGSEKQIDLNFRIVAAVKGELDRHVKQGILRSDLVFRLNVAALEIPALRERRQDIEMLFLQFAEGAAATHNKPLPKLTEKLRAQLNAYDWPGNVRELKNAAERFVIGLPLNFNAPSATSSDDVTPLDEAVDGFEKAHILKALNQSDGVIGAAADLLGIPRKKLYLRMKKHQIDKNYTD